MGSEMCIRDRKNWVRIDLADHGPGVPTDALARIFDKFYRVPGTCLLYTSDAADERSSVDLGGRRIIKKKNKRG